MEQGRGRYSPRLFLSTPSPIKREHTHTHTCARAPHNAHRAKSTGSALQKALSVVGFATPRVLSLLSFLCPTPLTHIRTNHTRHAFALSQRKKRHDQMTKKTNLLNLMIKHLTWRRPHTTKFLKHIHPHVTNDHARSFDTLQPPLLPPSPVLPPPARHRRAQSPRAPVHFAGIRTRSTPKRLCIR